MYYNMKISNIAISSSIVVLLFLVIPLVAFSPSPLTTFVECLRNHSSPSHTTFNGNIYTQKNSSFPKALQFYERNLRFNFSSSLTPKPLAIITVMNASDVQATVSCSKTLGLLIKIRSGGHDYDGLSYLSNVPYIVLDLYNLRSISIDSEKETAWVESGATLGELYYKVAKTSNNIKAFPAGVCPTVGVGGHFSGGGYGSMLRKFGLTVDNIIDAKIVDVNGRILDRKAMGEDLFWAIRGGGGASFGVILSWKIKLVTVPDKVTVFKVVRTLEKGASDLVYNWQNSSTKLPKEIFIRLVMDVKGAKADDKLIRLTHWGLFLGNVENLMSLMTESFPELGFAKSDGIEMSWLKSTVFWAEFPKGTPVDVLLKRTEYIPTAFKIKSDYVYEVIPKSDLETIFKKMIEVDNVIVKFNPYGGKMSETGVAVTPYPHRNALFKIQYLTTWKGDNVAEKNLDLSRRFYDFMAPYVSKSPREAFLNYRDIDIGNSPYCNATLEQAKGYLVKYFKGNLDRLAKVKSKVDPSDFFRNEQSIPPLLQL